MFKPDITGNECPLLAFTTLYIPECQGSNKCFINSLETSWRDSKWGCIDSGLNGKNCSYYNGGIGGTSDLKLKAFIWNLYYT
jgi:hypothetical protein